VPRPTFASAFCAVLVAFVLAGCTHVSDPTSPAAATPAPSRGQPRDAYVLLSGGGTPLSNNYSQYLQARAIAAFFGRECPPDATWVFFGIGNQEGAAPILADARRETKAGGLLVQSWLPGALPRNRPATKESFLKALREEVLPTVRDGGTLYLLVGDHGELAGTGDKRESAITLWQLKRGRRRAGGWYSDDKEILGVAELRKVLEEGLGRGRVVFGMTQCHSGGFHELGVAREMIPPREWFATAPPAWATGTAPGVRLRVAGFTAVDEASPASGCDADPDPERWAGYERFLPEALLGLDLMTGNVRGPGVRSLAAAHEAATLVDHTIDLPRATSEHYLEAWARLVETKLATTLSVTSWTQQAVTAFQRAVDRGTAPASDPALRERQEQFARFTQRLAEHVPAAKELLLNGSRQQLQAAITGRGERTSSAGGGGGGRGGRRGALAELRKVWSETLRPAWKTALLGGKVPGLSSDVVAFEKQLLELEDGGRELFLPRGNDDTPLMNEVYWNSSYAEPATLNRVKAEDVARWGASRRPQIIAWAKTQPDERVRAAAEKIGPGPVHTEEPVRPLSRKTAAERVLFYRRVLAAWEFLIAMDAKTALAEVQTLIELERLPLRLGDLRSEI